VLNGDLSNEISPRVLIVFEGLIGWLPPEKVDEYVKHKDAGHWNSAISCFTINNQVLNKILYLTWKSNYNIHVVTWFPEAAAETIQEKLEMFSIPVRSVFSSSPEALAKMLVYNPDIVAVYDTVPQHVLTFGSKAKLITDINQIGE